MTQGFTGDHALDNLQLRDAAVAILQAWKGLNPGDPRYAATLFPHDDPHVPWIAKMILHASSCGITREALLRALRLAVPAIMLGPYGPRTVKPGEQAIEVEIAWARQIGALVECTHWVEAMGLPLPGDGVLIGLNGGGPDWVRNDFADEHMDNVVDRDDDIVTCISGGQPGIAEVQRRLVYVEATSGVELWFAHPKFGTSPDGRPVKGRRVRMWTVLTSMPLAEAADTDPAPPPSAG